MPRSTGSPPSSTERSSAPQHRALAAGAHGILRLLAARRGWRASPRSSRCRGTPSVMPSIGSSTSVCSPRSPAIDCGHGGGDQRLVEDRGDAVLAGLASAPSAIRAGEGSASGRQAADPDLGQAVATSQIAERRVGGDELAALAAGQARLEVAGPARPVRRSGLPRWPVVGRMLRVRGRSAAGDLRSDGGHVGRVQPDVRVQSPSRRRGRGPRSWPASAALRRGRSRPRSAAAVRRWRCPARSGCRSAPPPRPPPAGRTSRR